FQVKLIEEHLELMKEMREMIKSVSKNSETRYLSKIQAKKYVRDIKNEESFRKLLIAGLQPIGIPGMENMYDKEDIDLLMEKFKN
ncbi:MAG: hypothetical protein ACRCTN_11015, partial [Carnobacterium maltaromaticum]